MTQPARMYLFHRLGKNNGSPRHGPAYQTLQVSADLGQGIMDGRRDSFALWAQSTVLGSGLCSSFHVGMAH
jgi:hypothetical protein